MELEKNGYKIRGTVDELMSLLDGREQKEKVMPVEGRAKNGRRLPRPYRKHRWGNGCKAYNDLDVMKIVKLSDQGVSIKKIAKEFNRTPQGIAGLLNRVKTGSKAVRVQ